MHALLVLLAAVPDAGQSFTVTGRVVDENGTAYGNVDFTLMDTTRLSGLSDGYCGTYYSQKGGSTDDAGTFAMMVPFAPNSFSYRGGLPSWVEPLEREVSITPGVELVFNVKTIPHEEVRGRVVDADGAAVSGAHIAPSASRSGARDSDETGAFSFETASPASGTVRVRKMGFEPVTAALDALDPVRLEKRRALITVTVVDQATWNPVRGELVVVTAFKGGERVSFCSAGDAVLTHEPRDGECTLDASEGDLELRAHDTVAWVRVRDVEPQRVTLTVKLPSRAELDARLRRARELAR